MARLAPYSELDFFEIKSNLISFLSNQERFKGYDFEGSNMNVLVDLMAYNAYNNMLYYNMSLGEMFLDSAQIKNSVISHAKELNYLPRSRRSSSALVNLTINSTQASNSFILPRGLQFLGRCGNITYTFITTQTYTAHRVSGNQFTVSDVAIYEGRVINEYLKYNNTVLSNAYLDTRSVRVFVNGNEFQYKSTIFGVNTGDFVFYLQPELNNKFSVQFGQNKFGYQPTATDQIRVEYRVCSGEEANGVAGWSVDGRSIGATSIVVLPKNVSVGGAESESIESIRQFAPKAIQVQERAVTAKDYEILLTSRFPEIESISVFGGDEVDPPQFGRVIIAVDSRGRDGASASELALYKTYIKDKSPLTIEPVFQSAQFMYAKLNLTVKYNRNDTLVTAPQIEALVRDALDTYNDDNLNRFASNLIMSDLTYQLSLADPSIVSISVAAHPVIDFVPALNVLESPSFHFRQELVKPYPYNDAAGLEGFKPSVTSTQFTIQGTVVELQDDGNGVIQALVANTNERSVFKRNIGTVDYTTGTISLKNLEVQSFEGDHIKIIVNTLDNDIMVPKDRIFRTRQADTIVTVRPV